MAQFYLYLKIVSLLVTLTLSILNFFKKSKEKTEKEG